MDIYPEVDEQQFHLWDSIKTDRSVYVGVADEYGFLYSEQSRGADQQDLLMRQAVEMCKDCNGKGPTWARITWSMTGLSKNDGLLCMGVDGRKAPAVTNGYKVTFTPPEISTAMSAWGWVSLFSTTRGIKAAVRGADPW